MNRTNCFGHADFADGAVYTGEWKSNQPHGSGTYSSPSGSAYDGEFKLGQPHGRGTYVYGNTEYTGQFRNGRFFGPGTLQSRHGHILADGIWSTNKDVTIGTALWHLVSETERMAVFIAPKSIRRQSGKRLTWLMHARLKPDEVTKALSSRTLEEFDCRNQSARVISFEQFYGHFGMGGSIPSDGPDGHLGVENHAAPGTVADSIMQYVCGYDLSAKNSK